jgi:hypothetical protein
MHIRAFVEVKPFYLFRDNSFKAITMALRELYLFISIFNIFLFLFILVKYECAYKTCVCYDY